PDLVSFTAPAASATLAVVKVPATLVAVKPVSLAATQPKPLKPIMASTPIKPTPKAIPVAPKPRNPETSGTELAANVQRVPGIIPAKATLDQKAHAPQSAVLLYWQETYQDDSGVIVQRTFWRVVVLHNPTLKEQPQKNI
ncbi:MAG: hypothetical protein ACXVZV_15615, partial [Terriglobales bacterium]